MKVSIVDDEKAKNESKKDSERKKWHGKVHTLDDLPPDQFEFGNLFGPPPPDPPEVNVKAGRRLGDGKVVYSASFPNLMDYGVNFGSFDLQLEYIILFIIIVFMVGIYIGKRVSAARHNKQIKQMQLSHAKQLSTIKHALVSRATTSATPPAPMTTLPPQPIYILQPAAAPSGGVGNI